MSNPVLSARSRLNAIRQHRGDDDPAVADATRDLAAEKIAAYVAKTVADIPPLTDEQRARIVDLLSDTRLPATPAG